MSEQDASIIDVRKRIDSMKDDLYKYAFMYQFLVGAEISEVCGKYAPDSSDIEEIEFEINEAKYPAVIFYRHKARGKGKHQASILPLDKEIEPWSSLVLNWFKTNSCQPFVDSNIHIESNKKYAMSKAKKVFSGLKWEKEAYWNPKTGEKIERRFVDFTSDSLKSSRIRNLKEVYYFNAVDLALFCGWNEQTIDLKETKEKEYALKINYAKDNIKFTKKIANQYFEKLLRPITQLEEEKYAYHFRIEERGIVERRNKAIRICNLIKNTNILSESIFGDPFFKEHLRTVLELFEPCNSENEFIVKISGLASLFEIGLPKLKRKFPEHGELKNIRLLEKWLEREKISYDKEMIQTWLHIVSLRNMEPIHSRIDGAELKEIVQFFGLKLRVPQNYNLLWERIMDKFRISLEQWLDLLNEYNSKPIV